VRGGAYIEHCGNAYRFDRENSNGLLWRPNLKWEKILKWISEKQDLNMCVVL
jgi:hypothetical protein